MIMKWVKKPVVVEAIQWTGDNIEEMKEFGVETDLDILDIGGYVVKETNGSLYAYSQRAFYAVYERHLVWDDNI
jgi:hypothetical protein